MADMMCVLRSLDVIEVVVGGDGEERGLDTEMKKVKGLNLVLLCLR